MQAVKAEYAAASAGAGPRTPAQPQAKPVADKGRGRRSKPLPSKGKTAGAKG
jgi:hypothetical protein